MKTYKVIPYNRQNGISAPAIYIDSSDEKNVPKLAREKSGLGRFVNWVFNGFTELKHKRNNLINKKHKNV